MDLPVRSETYSEPSQVSKMMLFANIVNGQKPVTIFLKSPIFDVWEGTEHVFMVISITEWGSVFDFDNAMCEWQLFFLHIIFSIKLYSSTLRYKFSQCSGGLNWN